MAKADNRRVTQLFDAAAQAMAAGRASEAQRLTQQAETEAPGHPLVLNEVGKRKILAGDPAGAFAVLDQAIKDDPSHPALWLNLSSALHLLGRFDEEMTALNKVLLLEPTNLRALMQAASLSDQQGDTKTAAATYRKALQM